jgi:23S rRNA (uracil1939-C5)-methyltransferase
MEPELIEIELTGMAYGGTAIGRLPDGRAVFVPYGLPGERVSARIVEAKRGYARADLVEVMRASPQRVTPRCPHFGACGGCHYQHLAYPDQLELKRGILLDQLERIGGIVDAPVLPVTPSPAEWYYRNQLQFHLAPDGRLGFQALDSHRVIPIQVCFLPEPAVAESWRSLDVEALPGLERVILRQDTGGELMLVLQGNDPLPPEFDVDFPISAVYEAPEGSHLLAGDPYLVMDVAGRAFRVSAGSFFQVNTRQAEAVVARVLELLPGGGTLMDVYSGVGLFSAFLAPRFKEVIGVELSVAACDDFAANLDEFDHVSLYQGTAEDVLPALNARADALLVDPPRAGIDRRALDAIIAMQPAQLVYVSCDPATLARDLNRLNPEYKLQTVQAFDFFPRTPHLEVLSRLERVD